MPLLDTHEETIADDPAEERRPGFFDLYVPPYDVTAEMLFAAAFCPTAWLKQSFPDAPFLSLFGKTPVIFWFSRFNQVVYHLPEGGTDVKGRLNGTLYNELNIMALLRRPAFFVPGIYASSEFSLRMGRAYGMPKQLTDISYDRQGSAIFSECRHGGRRSYVQAQVQGNGRTLSALARRILPMCIWAARFPGGPPLRPLLEEIPRLTFARIRQGQVWVNEPYMPEPLPLLPFGFHAVELRMKLPPRQSQEEPSRFTLRLPD